MKRRRTKQEQKLVDDARLLKTWRGWHREQRAVVLAGLHGASLHELFRALATLKLVQPPQLIEFVRAIDWALIDAHTRTVVLHKTPTAMTKLHENQHLMPIDDPLPGSPPNAFQMICAIVNAFPAPAGKAASAGTDADKYLSET